MIEVIEVQPCPFCGEHGFDVLEVRKLQTPSLVVAFVECHGCGATGPVDPRAGVAVAMWNRAEAPG